MMINSTSLKPQKLSPMLKKIFLGITTSLIAFSPGIDLTLAADPFRTTDPRPIGSQTEAAFKAMFEQGNYKETQNYLEKAKLQEPNEPLVYALLASLAYQNQDFNALKSYSDQTLQSAKLLSTKDPLRGNLYIGVGLFLQGGHTILSEGTLKGAPKALKTLQEVLKSLNVAEKINPSDPELNLIQGYMDLLLSLNLPFADSKKAIDKLEKQAKPSYLAYRGIALGYQTLGQSEQALNYTKKALTETPNHPEVLYLKAQILAKQGEKLKVATPNTIPSQLQEAQQYFSQALKQSDQLPKRLVAQIFYEQCKNLNRIDNQGRPCDPLRDKIKDADGLWGPISSQLPPL